MLIFDMVSLVIVKVLVMKKLLVYHHHLQPHHLLVENQLLQHHQFHRTLKVSVIYRNGMYTILLSQLSPFSVIILVSRLSSFSVKGDSSTPQPVLVMLPVPSKVKAG